jgi:hypothetical protein
MLGCSELPTMAGLPVGVIDGIGCGFPGSSEVLLHKRHDSECGDEARASTCLIVLVGLILPVDIGVRKL